MDRHALNTKRSLRAVLLVHLDRLHLRQRREPVVANHPAKYGVEAVEVRRAVEQDKELGSVGARALVGHGHDAAVGVPQSRAYLVGEDAAPDGPSALGVIGGRGHGRSAGLDHELRDEAVKGRLVVVAGRAEGEKVLRRKVE